MKYHAECSDVYILSNYIVSLPDMPRRTRVPALPCLPLFPPALLPSLSGWLLWRLRLPLTPVRSLALLVIALTADRRPPLRASLSNTLTNYSFPIMSLSNTAALFRLMGKK